MDPRIRIPGSIEQPVFHWFTDKWMIFFTHELMCTSISCLAKEDPDNNASFCLSLKQRE